MEFFPNEIYVIDKAYVDFEALFRIDQAGAFFVTRAKGDMKYEVVETNGNINEETGLKGDYTIFLTGLKTKSLYPKPLRLVKACDEESGEVIDFISNSMEIDALESPSSRPSLTVLTPSPRLPRSSASQLWRKPT